MRSPASDDPFASESLAPSPPQIRGMMSFAHNVSSVVASSIILEVVITPPCLQSSDDIRLNLR